MNHFEAIPSTTERNTVDGAIGSSTGAATPPRFSLFNQAQRIAGPGGLVCSRPESKVRFVAVLDGQDCREQTKRI